jgi:hypothetical protein
LKTTNDYCLSCQKGKVTGKHYVGRIWRLLCDGCADLLGAEAFIPVPKEESR